MSCRGAANKTGFRCSNKVSFSMYINRRVHVTTANTNVSLMNFNSARTIITAITTKKMIAMAHGGSPGIDWSSPYIRAFCCAFSRFAITSSIIAVINVHIIDRRNISDTDHKSVRKKSRERHSSSHQMPYLYTRWHMFQSPIS
jgi:hypothetical protein